VERKLGVASQSGAIAIEADRLRRWVAVEAIPVMHGKLRITAFDRRFAY